MDMDMDMEQACHSMGRGAAVPVELGMVRES